MTPDIALYSPLRDAEREALTRCEDTIRGGLESFTAVGLALVEVRASKLYRGAYKSFEAYCRDRWGISSRRANQQIGAAQVSGIISAKDEAAALVGTIVPAPQTESQARELHALRNDPVAVREVWTSAVDRAGGKQPTAAGVKQARKDHEQKQAARRVVRQERAATAEQQKLDAYVAEHGHSPDHLGAGYRLQNTEHFLSRVVGVVEADTFDYTADERAGLMEKADSIRELLDRLTAGLLATREVSKAGAA